jgi:hypothetical protein
MSSLNLHGSPEAGQGVETAAHDVTKNRSGRRWLAKRRPAECGLVPAKTKEAPRSAPSPDENENAGGTPMTKSPDASNPRSDDISDQASRSTLALNPLSSSSEALMFLSPEPPAIFSPLSMSRPRIVFVSSWTSTGAARHIQDGAQHWANMIAPRTEPRITLH